MDERKRGDDSGWRWRYSPLTGIMYGPVPVGIIVVLLGLLAYFAFFNR